MHRLVHCWLTILLVTSVHQINGDQPANNFISNAHQLEYYYSVNEPSDARYVVEQLQPMFNCNTFDTLSVQFAPVGGISMLQVETAQYYCVTEPSLCQTSIIHYCAAQKLSPETFVDFVKCYFESEHFGNDDLLQATEQCLTKSPSWPQIETCSKDAEQFELYTSQVVRSEQLRPPIDQTPYLRVDREHSPLAQMNLALAISAFVNPKPDSENCPKASMMKNLPTLQLLYTPTESKSRQFFSEQVYHVALRLNHTVSKLTILPYTDNLQSCSNSDSVCWITKANICVQKFITNIIDVINLIQCTFERFKYEKPREKLQSCFNQLNLPITIQTVEQCVENENEQMLPLYKQLDATVRQLGLSSASLPVTVIDNRVNYKTQNGLLEELCLNHIQEENLAPGCFIEKPKIGLYYESNSQSVLDFFINQFMQYGELVPFDELIELEMIPYGNTSYQNGVYKCPLGENQCHANWISACLIKQQFDSTEDKYSVIQALLCAQTSNSEIDPVQALEMCINNFLDNGPEIWPSLVDCAHSDSELKDEMRKKTSQITLTEIPEVTVDMQLLNKSKLESNSLLEYLCQNQYKLIKPRQCYEIQSDHYQTLEVSLYISGDDNSERMFAKQIAPILSNEPEDSELRLRDVINWDIVPWGSAIYNQDNQTVTCPGDERECLASRVLFCGVKQAKSRLPADKMNEAKFVQCLFANSHWKVDPLEVANECANLVLREDSFGLIWQCVKQPQKQSQWLRMENRTLSNYPKLKSFPTITIDQQQIRKNETDQNLIQLLCARYKAFPLPKECKNGANIITIGASLFWFVLIIKFLI